jgi:hypothetical protein
MDDYIILVDTDGYKKKVGYNDMLERLNNTENGQNARYFHSKKMWKFILNSPYVCKKNKRLYIGFWDCLIQQASDEARYCNEGFWFPHNEYTGWSVINKLQYI